MSRVRTPLGVVASEQECGDLIDGDAGEFHVQSVQVMFNLTHGQTQDV